MKSFRGIDFKKRKIFKSGCYNGEYCYGGIIYCIDGNITVENMDKILNLMDYYCDIQEILIREELKEN